MYVETVRLVIQANAQYLLGAENKRMAVKEGVILLMTYVQPP